MEGSPSVNDVLGSLLKRQSCTMATRKIIKMQGEHTGIQSTGEFNCLKSTENGVCSEKGQQSFDSNNTLDLQKGLVLHTKDIHSCNKSSFSNPGPAEPGPADHDSDSSNPDAVHENQGKFKFLPPWSQLFSFEWLRETEVILPPFRCEEKHSKSRASSKSHKSEKRVHKPADSLFSTSSGFKDFRGFFNLAVLLLVLSSARVALENVIKYGLLVDPFMYLQMFLLEPHSVPSLGIVLFSNVFILFAFQLEWLLKYGYIPEKLGMFLHTVNVSLSLIVPCMTVLERHPNPIFSSVALILCVTVFLKLISYIQTNRWSRQHYHSQLRAAKLDRIRHKSISKPADESDADLAGGDYFRVDVKSEDMQHYPDNINLKDLYYFMVLPTLCYELQFPRSSRLRKRFLLKRITESIFLTGLILALVQQWVLPLITNALVPFNNMQYSKMLERILKLALPNFCIWGLWFYVTFHSIFNVIAEVFRFADRTFYDDWWNAETVGEFWKKWNIPVHRWAVRHLYKPLLSCGASPIQAAMSVFFVSAFFHELLVSVPLGILRFYAFFGMLFQIPLALLTTKLHPITPKFCNVIVWCSLILGQPIAVLMYCVDYYIERYATVS